MALRTWWLQNRLRGVERTLKRLRARQRQLREEESALAKQGLTPDARAAKEAKLHEEREAVTRQVNEAIAREDDIKRELAATEGTASSS